MLPTAFATGSIGIIAAHLLLGVGFAGSFGIRPLTKLERPTAASEGSNSPARASFDELGEQPSICLTSDELMSTTQVLSVCQPPEQKAD